MARRIGLLTGGGDCPGLNAVIWGVVRAATRFGLDVVGIEDGFEGLIRTGKIRALCEDDIRGILPLGGTMLGTTNRGNPFSYKAEVDGREVTIDRSDEVLNAIARLRLEGLIAIGGDGSLRIAYDLAQKGARIIGVPKTIDNDLGATDYTFGYYTAATTAMEALDKLKTTAESHERVMILEVMGRYCGWIAIESGISGGAHVILIPEIPYHVESVLAKVRARREEEGRNYTLIVIAEGARPFGGDISLREGSTPGMVERLGGAAERLAAELREHLVGPGAPEIRATVLGHLQRGGSPCAFDRTLSVRFGAEAARLAFEANWGRMVCLRQTEISSVPLVESIAEMHTVDPAGQLVAQARSVGICFGDPCSEVPRSSHG